MSASMGITILVLSVDFCARCTRFRNLFRCHILVCDTCISFECTLQGKLVSDCMLRLRPMRMGRGREQSDFRGTWYGFEWRTCRREFWFNELPRTGTVKLPSIMVLFVRGQFHWRWTICLVPKYVGNIHYVQSHLPILAMLKSWVHFIWLVRYLELFSYFFDLHFTQYCYFSYTRQAIIAQIMRPVHQVSFRE